MTDQDEKATDAGESKQQRWYADVQDALERTGDALRTAWEATRESRMSALESAKQAAQELGEVIDQGLTAAKERWVAAEQEPKEAETSLADEVVAEDPVVSEAEPTPTSDKTVIPVEGDTSDQA